LSNEVPNIAVSHDIVKWWGNSPLVKGDGSVAAWGLSLVMHAVDNYNAQDCHRPSEAVVQSCLFMPLASLLRVTGMTTQGPRPPRRYFPIANDEPRGPQAEDLQ
jgi:hypothetical protein